MVEPQRTHSALTGPACLAPDRPLRYDANGTSGRSAWWTEQANAVAQMQADVLYGRRRHSAAAKEWLRRSYGGCATADRMSPEPELEPGFEPASGSILMSQPMVWGARAGSEWKLTQRGLEEEAERNEVNILWRGTGPLGVMWRSLRHGGNEYGLDDSDQQLYACVRRTFSTPGPNPRAPYDTTAEWLRMVGKQAKDDEQHRQRSGAPAALQAGTAQGFSASFNESAERKQSTGAYRSVKPPEDDPAREQLVPGLLLHRLQGKILDPTGLVSLQDALQPLRQLRSDATQSVVHTTFLHDHGRYYEACFYERNLPQLYVVQPRSRDRYGASSACFGVRLASTPKAGATQTRDERLHNGQGDNGRFGWSTEMRPRLAEATERGMMIAAIQGEPTEEWSRVDVVTRLQNLWNLPGRPVRITFVACRASAAWGGLHDRARGATPVQPLPVASRHAWEALLAAGRWETAARRNAVAQLVEAEGRAPAIFMKSIGADSENHQLSLADCYKVKYGEQRPAADKNWDQY